MIAVHRPVYPPPTTHRSHVSVRTSVGFESGSSASSYQYGYGSASAIASRWASCIGGPSVAGHRSADRRRSLTIARRGRFGGMDLGIAGQAGGGGRRRRLGSASRRRRRSSPRASRWRSAGVTRAGSTPPRTSSATGRRASSPTSAPPPVGAAFVDAAREALGGLDILVTNAGGPPPGNFATTDGRRLSGRARAEPALGRGDVQGRRPGDAGAALGAGGGDHVGLGAPADRRR